VSYSNRFTGEITITPPLTAAEIRRAPDLDQEWDVHLRVTETTEQTPDGEITRYSADAIVGPDEPCNGYDAEDQIRGLVALFADGHEFSGHIQVDWDPGFGDPPDRYVVRGREVVKVSPVIVWPDEAGA
jgi:hypothetical protein